MLAGPSPEVLIGPIASATEAIRVGSGGVMLPHYSPLKVAESFTILAALFPGRIDLGLGRASGTDPMTTYALQRDRRQASPDDFPQQLAELLAYFEDDLPADHPFRHLAKVAAGPARAAGAMAAGLVGAERDLGRRARPPLRVRRLHQPRRLDDRRDLSRAFPARPGAAGAAHRGRGLGAVRADRRGGGVPGVLEQDGDDDAATRQPGRGAAARARGQVPQSRGDSARRAPGWPTDDRRLAGEGPSRRRGARRPSTSPTR